MKISSNLYNSFKKSEDWNPYIQKRPSLDQNELSNEKGDGDSKDIYIPRRKFTTGAASRQQCCQVYGFFFRSEEILNNLRFLKNLKKFDRNLKMFFNVFVSKVYYVPRRTMRVIARRATMLAGDRSQGVVEA